MSDWTAGLRGRGRNRPEVVDIASIPRLTSVAFDQFVFDERGILKSDGSGLAFGTRPDGTAIAVASALWPGMPIEWIALQSRRAPDLLGLAGDEMAPVGHRSFDERFAVDADDVSLFRKQFRTSLRDWLVEFDDAHGPLIVIFDGSSDRAAAPRRRAGDQPAAGGSPDDDPADAPAVFVARVVTDNTAVIPTLGLVAELTASVQAAFEH